MIISLRGTNGAGKSHLVRELMRSYDQILPVMSDGRRRPLGYDCAITGYLASAHCRTTVARLWIVGHYEIANGGIDTLGSLDEAYAEIASRHLPTDSCRKPRHVIYEGKNLSDGPGRLLDLAKSADVRVVHLDTPLEECVASVRARGHKIREETIARLHEKSRRDVEHFRQIMGESRVFVGQRAECLVHVKKVLEIP